MKNFKLYFLLLTIIICKANLVLSELLITKNTEFTDGNNCIKNNDVCEYIDDSKKYEPNWESLDARPIPAWYDSAKVGIFIHWGVYSVPSLGSEWFWINWKGEKVPKYVDFMNKNYRPGFTYQEFAKDFRGELFNATQWALLFKDSGAKYVVLTSKHHDGYTLWPSTKSFSWNAKDVGPNIDIIRELSFAIRNLTSMKFGLYYSLFEWFNRMYINDKLHAFLNNDYVVNKALPELKELIFQYKPEIIWSDGDWEAPHKYWDSLNFLTWLYNESPVRDTVVVNDRWGINMSCKHGGFYTCSDRYNPGVLQKHKFENAMTLDKTTWGHRSDTTLKDYLTSKELINELVITVSCGGNILINVGPTSYGTIEPIFEERLRDLGKWLKINGEAIYSSRPWIYQNDTKTPGVWYTEKDDETTNERMNVYAIILNYPFKTNTIDLFAMSEKIDSLTEIQLLGFSTFNLEWSYRKKILHVILPPKHLIDGKGLEFAWTIKLNILKKNEDDFL